MSATSTPSGRVLDPATDNGAVVASRPDAVDHGRRLSTETKSAFKTTEFVAYIVALVGVLIAGAVTKASSYGANHDPFRPSGPSASTPASAAPAETRILVCDRLPSRIRTSKAPAVRFSKRGP